jgi:cellulose synthase/poly-beta-1,6-N-acetylglucosamine synthase-like glycosyltransferase
MGLMSGCYDEEFKSLFAIKTERLIREHDAIKYKPLIYDTIIFNDEIDLLLLRLEILQNLVDGYIIVESRKTFTGNNKVLHFDLNKELFKKYQYKITHIILDELLYSGDDINTKQVWENEYYSRNAIANGLIKLNATDEDVIILADVDEIPHPNAINTIISLYSNPDSSRKRIYKLYPLNFMYKFDCYIDNDEVSIVIIYFYIYVTFILMLLSHL